MGRRSYGNVRKLPSGRWHARHRSPINPDQWVNAPTTFDAKMDAETWLATVRTDITRGTWAPRRAKHTFAHYAETWLLQRDLKPRTAHHYRVILDKFLIPAFGDTDLAQITPIDVRAWYARLATGPTYKAHTYSLLRTIMRTAVDDGMIAASPCVLRGAGSTKRQVQIRPATVDELTALVAAMPEQLQLTVILAGWCGLRYGEIAELRRRDVDLKAGVIHVRRGVTWVQGEAIIGTPKSAASVRDVHLPEYFAPAVRAHLEKHTQWGRDGLLFPNSSGGNLHSATFYESWWPAREAASRPDLRFHDLRHVAAVLAASTGATLAELMARLGHTTPAAAMRYQHASRDRDAEIAKALSKLAEQT